jgi:F-type H+-transporting ATPase subunit a
MGMDPVQIAAHHVEDATAITLPFGAKIDLPEVFGFQVTKLMALELAAAVLMVLIFVPMAWKIGGGKPPRGRWWNMLDAAILFIRNEVVRPAIGRRDADRFLPFILTLFFFILFCNLLGLFPWLGSPTGSINVTGALAAVAFAVVAGAGMKRHGALKFWTGLCPPMDVPRVMAVFLVPMILSIEILGLLIRHTILAVRLLANMFAGHLVLGVVVAFIPLFVHSLLWYGVAPAAVLGATALNLLELFIAFLQAYVFAFLTALFIGMSIHQH